MTADVANALTFDLEHWYSATLVRDHVTHPTDRLRESVERVLELLREYEVSATFFVVGEVAREHPDVVRTIADEGHELGSHGDSHTPLFELNEASFERELERSVAAIRDAADVRPTGFRAPNFSVAPGTDWAFEVLEAVGFEYDSSLFPVRTPMYGVSGAPVGPYWIDFDRPFSNTRESSPRGGLVELPVAIHPRLRFPVAGGFYARVLPARILEWGIRSLNRNGHPAVLYFHPWEFDPAVESREPPLHKRFVSYYGIDRLETKVERLLRAFEFGNANEVITSLVYMDE